MRTSPRCMWATTCRQTFTAGCSPSTTTWPWAQVCARERAAQVRWQAAAWAALAALCCGAVGPQRGARALPHTPSAARTAAPAGNAWCLAPPRRARATGTVVNKTAIKQYQQATRDRAKVKTEGGKIIRCAPPPPLPPPPLLLCVCACARPSLGHTVARGLSPCPRPPHAPRSVCVCVCVCV
jgi:hypothetical protein